MNAKSLIVAAALFVSGASAFAAESPEPAAAAGATASAGVTAGATASASNLNLPALGAPSHSSRDEAKAEAVDFVKNYKTALAVQLEQYKN